MIANLKALKGRASLARLGGWRRLGGLAQRAWFISKKGLQTFSTEALFVGSAGAVSLLVSAGPTHAFPKKRGGGGVEMDLHFRLKNALLVCQNLKTALRTASYALF